MRIATILLVICSTFLLSGCVFSLNPLYTEKDQVFDPALVGTWLEKDSEDTCIVEKGEGNAYRVTNVYEGKSAKFEAHLVRLGKFLFLDLYPEHGEDFESALIAVHGFSRVRIEGDVLRFAWVDGSWLRDLIHQKKVKIASRVDERLVIVVSSRRAYRRSPETRVEACPGLQSFWGRHDVIPPEISFRHSNPLLQVFCFH